MPGGYAVRAKNGFTLVPVSAHSDEELKIATSWDKLISGHAYTLTKATAGIGNLRR